MLLFELFPAFLTLVSIVVAIVLFVANRGAGDDPAPKKRPPRCQPADETSGARRGGLRPSMRA